MHEYKHGCKSGRRDTRLFPERKRHWLLITKVSQNLPETYESWAHEQHKNVIYSFKIYDT